MNIDRCDKSLNCPANNANVALLIINILSVLIFGTYLKPNYSIGVNRLNPRLVTTDLQMCVFYCLSFGWPNECVMF